MLSKQWWNIGCIHKAPHFMQWASKSWSHSLTDVSVSVETTLKNKGLRVLHYVIYHKLNRNIKKYAL